MAQAVAQPVAQAAALHRRPGLTLYRYVAGEAVRPTLIALVGFTVAVLTKDLLVFSDLVLNRGLGAGAVALMAFYQAVPVAAQIFPFAVLTGCMVALGRLGADREILALESLGVAAARLTWPIVSFAGAMTVVSILLSLQASPGAYLALDDALEAMAREKPWSKIRAGAATRFGGWQLDAREVTASGTGLRGVLLFMPTVGETIFAERASLEGGADGSVDIELENGSVLLSGRSGPRELRFDSMRTTLPNVEPQTVRLTDEEVRGLSLPELALQAREWLPTRMGSLSRAEVELHRRFALPFATLVFGLLTVPLFLMRSRFSRSSGGVMGLLCTLIYYGLIQAGEGFAEAGYVGAAVGVWLPNAVLVALALILLLRARREGVLGHAFDRPQRSRRANLRAHSSRVARVRRYPLPRYIAGRFVQLVGLSFAVLLTAYIAIDIMDRLEWFARNHAGGLEILRFYGARIPLLASRAVPMAILVATALTVSLLAAEGELIGMRSCGIAAPRALLPVLIIATLIGPLYFALNNVVVPRTNALADEIKRTEIKDRFYAGVRAKKRKAKFWRRSGDELLEANRFDMQRGVARELTIYTFGPDGLPASRTDAEFARHIGGGRWRLYESRRVEISESGHVAVAAPPRFAELGEALPAEVDTMHLSVAELAREAEEIEADGYDATSLRVDYQVRLAEPFVCVVLPAVALFFAVGGPPFPGPAQTLLVSGALGVGYILLAGVSASLGYGGVVPPWLAGWSPTFLFSGLAGFFGARLWRRL